MKNKLLNLLLLANDLPLVSKIYIFYYSLAIKTVKYFISEKVTHLYLKGSFKQEHFIPVLSDLDFFLVGDASFESRKEIAKIFDRIGYIFPMVSDFDFHTEQDFYLLKNFGGLKYVDVHEWECLKGEQVDFSYRFNPRKLKIDLIHEIYFQFEWLFRNIKLRKKGCGFSTRKLYRQYEKVQDLLNYGNSFGETKYYIKKRKSVFNKRWIDYSNERILFLFNDLIENNYFIKNNREKFFYHFRKRDFNSILSEKFYKQKVEIISQENFLITEEKEIYLSLNNLKLFYYVGSIDSYLLFDWTRESSDCLSSKYIELLYYSRLLERRWNSRHDEYYYSKNFDRAKKLISLIEGIVRFEKYSPIDFSGKSIYLTVSSHLEDYKKQTQANLELKNVFHFHVHLGREVPTELNRDVCLLHIMSEAQDSLLDQRNALINLGVDWLFGAEVILLGSQSNFQFNLKALDKELSLERFVQIKGLQGLGSLWIGKSWLWHSLLPIFRFDSNLNLDELLTYQITGEKNNSSYLNHNDNGLEKNIGYFKILKFNSVGSITTNEMNVEKSLYSLFPQFMELDNIGLVKIKESFIGDWNSLKILFSKNSEDPYYKLELLEKYIESLKSQGQKLNLSKISLHSSKLWSLEGPIALIEENSNGIKLATINGDKPIRCRLRFNHESMDSRNLQFFKFSFNNEISTEAANLNIENRNIFVKWGGQELYQMKFFVFLPGICDPGTITLELELKPGKTYDLKLEKYQSLDLVEKESLTYYKVDNYQKLSQVNHLAEVHSGFYKFVITFEKSLSGVFHFRNRNNTAKFQKFSIENSNTCIMYYYGAESEQDLILYGDYDIEFDISFEVSILKYTKDLF